MSETIQIYTDGSANCKTGLGAWAFVVVYPDQREESFSEAYEDVTNNRMELMAVIEVLAFIVRRASLHHGAKVSYEVYSDSQYVVNGVNEWRHKWKSKNWKNVKNVPLWLVVDSLCDIIKTLDVSMTLNWVRGHSGDKYNEMCDKLAHSAYKKLAETKKI